MLDFEYRLTRKITGAIVSDAATVAAQIGKEKQMKSNVRQQFNTISIQVGHMSASWLAINSLSCDRTPEGYNSPGSREGWDD